MMLFHWLSINMVRSARCQPAGCWSLVFMLHDRFSCCRFALKNCNNGGCEKFNLIKCHDHDQFDKTFFMTWSPFVIYIFGSLV